MPPPGPQQPQTVRRAIAPLAVSLLVHAALFAVLGFVTWTVVAPAPAPSTVLLESDDAGALSAPAGPSISTDDLAQTDRADRADGAAPSMVNTAPEAPAPRRPLESYSSTIAPRPGDDPAPRPRSGGETWSDLATSPSSGSLASFAGLRSRAAQRVVYVVDASGAMATSFDPPVVRALLASVSRLSPAQSFQVVLTRESPGDGAPMLDVFAPAPVSATPANRAELASWLSRVSITGRSNPLPGLEAALGFEPDLVFLLARSIRRSGPASEWGEGRDVTLQRLERLNPPSSRTGRRPSVIKTIQFLEPDPSGLMELIGERHGDGPGSHRVLTLDDLQRLNEQDESARELPVEIDPNVLALADQLGAIERDGSAAWVLFGRPPEEVRARVGRIAAAVARASADADHPGAQLIGARAAVLAHRASEAGVDAEGVDLADALSAAARVLVSGADAIAAREVVLIVGFSELGDRASADQTNQTPSPGAGTPGPIASAERTLAALVAAESPVAVARTERVLAARAGSAPFAGPDGPDPFWHLLAAEASVLARLRVGAPEPWQPLLERLDDPAPLVGRAGRDADTMRRLVASRIARLAASVPAPRPARVEFVRAVVLAADPATFEVGLASLRELSGADGPIAADALWELGALLLAHDRGAEGVGALADLARRFPDDARATPAFETALREATERGLDQLRLDLLRAAARPGSVARGDRVSNTLRAAAALLDDAGEDRTPEALALLGGLDPAPDTNAAVRSLVSSRPPDARWLPLLDRFGVPERSRWRFELADAAVDPNRAIALLTKILDLPPSDASLATVPGGRPAVHIRLARAERDAGDPDAAFARLASLVAAYDAAVAQGGSRDAGFWHAWSLLLEWQTASFSPDDRRGPAAATARAHLARLRSLDAGLGGEPWAGRLEAIADRLE